MECYYIAISRREFGIAIRRNLPLVNVDYLNMAFARPELMKNAKIWRSLGTNVECNNMTFTWLE